MDIQAAAASLQEKFGDASWLTMVGIGEHEGRECIFLYVKLLNAVPTDLLKRGWHGFPVVVRKMGQPRPLQAGRLLPGR